MEPGADRPRAGLLMKRRRRADRPSKRHQALRPPPMPVLRRASIGDVFSDRGVRWRSCRACTP